MVLCGRYVERVAVACTVQNGGDCRSPSARAITGSAGSKSGSHNKCDVTSIVVT